MVEAPRSLDSLIDPEARNKLKEAIKVVSEFYREDPTSVLLKIKNELLQLPDQRDIFWRAVELRHKSFSEIIKALSKTYRRSETTKLGRYFSQVEDKDARRLLADILFARITTLDDFETEAEAEAMATELGSDEGLQGKVMESLTLEEVIKSILTGELQLTGRTELEEK